MTIFKQFILTVVMSTVVAMPLAHAQEQDNKPRLIRENPEAQMYKKLELTDEQKKQMEATKQAKMKEAKALYMSMMDVNKRLNAELMKPELDADKIKALNEELKETQAKMADTRINSILSIRKTLSKEQFKKFVEIADKSREQYRKEHEGSEK